MNKEQLLFLKENYKEFNEFMANKNVVITLERLKKEASYVYDSGIGGDYTEVDLDKFAELILSKCLNLTLDYKNEDYYNGWLDYREKIKQIFGLE